MTFEVKFAMNIFVIEQKYATIADGIAFHLREKEGALQMLKLLILVTRASEVQFGLQSYR